MTRRLTVGFVLLAFLVAERSAHGGGLDFNLLEARGIGRGGANVVSEDGGPALVLNPAGLARRRALRLRASMSVHDDDSGYVADAAGPRIADRGPSLAVPHLSVAGTAGAVVWGLAYLTTGRLLRRLPQPPWDQPADEVARLFPHRYAGLSLAYQRRAAVSGAALRVTSWLALGASLAAFQVSLAESRHLWAGFAGRDPLADPRRDLFLWLSARDPFVPGANLGALIAPRNLPVEMALALSASGAAELRGQAEVQRTRNTSFPKPAGERGAASAQLVAPLILRVGLRYLGDRVLAEGNAELFFFPAPGRETVWHVAGIGAEDETAEVGLLRAFPSLVDQQSHLAARLGVDVEVVAGFLWLAAGYSYQTEAARASHMTAGHPGMGGHTLGLGLEGQWGHTTVTVGYARTLAPTVKVENSAVLLLNPFAAGTASVGNGRYDRDHDAFGLSLELALDSQ